MLLKHFKVLGNGSNAYSFAHAKKNTCFTTLFLFRNVEEFDLGFSALRGPCKSIRRCETVGVERKGVGWYVRCSD